MIKIKKIVNHTFAGNETFLYAGTCQTARAPIFSTVVSLVMTASQEPFLQGWTNDHHFLSTDNGWIFMSAFLTNVADGKESGSPRYMLFPHIIT